MTVCVNNQYTGWQHEIMTSRAQAL